MANPEPETSSRSSSRPTPLSAGQACRLPAGNGQLKDRILQSTRFLGLTTSSFATRRARRRATCSQAQCLHFARVLARERASASHSVRDTLFLCRLLASAVQHRTSLYKTHMQFDVEAVQYKLMTCTGSTGCRALMTPNEFKGIRNRSSVLTPAQERGLAADFHESIKGEELRRELRQREAESDRSPTFRHCGAKVFAPTVTLAMLPSNTHRSGTALVLRDYWRVVRNNRTSRQAVGRPPGSTPDSTRPDASENKNTH